MPIQIPSAGMVKGASPTIANAPDAPRGFFAGRGISVPRNRTTARASAFGGGQGAEAVNQALAGVIDGLGNELIKIQELENQTIAIQKQDEIRRRSIELAQEIKSDDGILPSQWYSTFQERSKNIESSVITDDMPPALRRAVQQDFSKAYGTMLIKMFEQGATETVTRSRDMKLYESDQAYNRNQPDAGDAIIDGASNQEISPAQKLELKAAGRAKAQLATANQMVLDNTEAYLDLRKEQDEYGISPAFDYLNVETLRKLDKKAQAVIGDRRETQLDSLVQRLKTGNPLKMASPEEIDAIDWMPEETKKHFKESYWDEKPREGIDKKEENLVREKILSFRPDSDFDKSKLLEIKSLMYSTLGRTGQKRMEDFLNERLDLLKWEKNQPKNSLLKQLPDRFKSGFFGLVVPEDGDPSDIARIEDYNENLLNKIATQFTMEWEEAGGLNWAESDKKLQEIGEQARDEAALERRMLRSDIISSPTIPRSKYRQSSGDTVDMPTDPVNPPLPKRFVDDNDFLPTNPLLPRFNK